MKAMKYWMEQSGIEFPQEGDEFHRVAAIYYMSNMGTLKDGKFGFIEGKLVSARITCEVDGYNNMNLVEQRDFYEAIERKM